MSKKAKCICCGEEHKKITLFPLLSKKLSKIIIHGGITFADFLALNSDKESRWYIGWDYGHLTDFNSLYVAIKRRMGMADGKKWTTQEIFNDAKKVINQISKPLKRN